MTGQEITLLVILGVLTALSALLMAVNYIWISQRTLRRHGRRRQTWHEERWGRTRSPSPLQPGRPWRHRR